MNSTGKPVDPVTVETTEQAPSRLRSGLLLLGGLLVVAVALVFGLRLFGILYGVLYPPEPPIPESATRLSREYEAHGVDIWRFVADEPIASVAAFYTERGGECAPRRSPGGALGEMFVSPDDSQRCLGVETFAIFPMRWEALLRADGNDTTVRLSREVFWIGSVPPDSPQLPTPDLS